MSNSKSTSSAMSIEKGEDGPLTGKPWFNLMVPKSALPPRNLLVIPKEGRAILPEDNVETTLTRGDKEWKVTYYGIGSQKRFDSPGWANFAKDNELAEGDACIFEVMKLQGKKMTLKVSVLSGEFPPELLRAGTEEDPIMLD